MFKWKIEKMTYLIMPRGSFHVKSTRGVHHTLLDFYEIFCE